MYMYMYVYTYFVHLSLSYIYIYIHIVMYGEAGQAGEQPGGLADRSARKLARHGNHWTSMEITRHQWKSVEINGNQLK